MQNVVILLGMLACLFGPSALFTLIGYKSLEAVSRRPSDSARVMIALVSKLFGATIVIMAILGAMLRTFAK